MFKAGSIRGSKSLDAPAACGQHRPAVGGTQVLPDVAKGRRAYGITVECIQCSLTPEADGNRGGSAPGVRRRIERETDAESLGKVFKLVEPGLLVRARGRDE